jgi:hypothetical protein
MSEHAGDLDPFTAGRAGKEQRRRELLDALAGSPEPTPDDAELEDALDKLTDEVAHRLYQRLTSEPTTGFFTRVGERDRERTAKLVDALRGRR